MSLLLLFPSGGSTPWEPTDDSVKRWYDAQDLSTMFTDTAGTTPVTTNGDLIARWNDKGTDADHATQSTSGDRPTYRTTSNVNSEAGVRNTTISTNEGMVITGGWGSMGELMSAGAIEGVQASFGSSYTSGVDFTNANLLSVHWDDGGGGAGAGTLKWFEKGAQVGSTVTGLTLTDSGIVIIGANLLTSGNFSFGRFLSGQRIFNRSTGGRAGDGDYTDILFWLDPAGDLDDLREKGEGYVGHKFGFTLASGHPYEFAPPTTGGGGPTIHEDTISEGIGTAEALTANQLFSVTVSEGVGTAEALAVSQILSVTVSEGVGTAETLIANEVTNVSLSDSVDVAEALLGGALIMDTISETVGVAEELTGYRIITDTLTDGIGNAEALGATAIYVGALTDNVNVTELASTGQQIDLEISEGIGVAETLIANEVTNVSLADAVGVAEALTANQGYAQTLTDTVGVAEELIANEVTNVSLADAVGVAEALTAYRIVDTTITDGVGTAPVLSEPNAILTQTVTDGLGILDAMSPAGLFNISLDDTLELSDSAEAERAVLTPSTEQNAQVTVSLPRRIEAVLASRRIISIVVRRNEAVLPSRIVVGG
jgi:hypothetical protein